MANADKKQSGGLGFGKVISIISAFIAAIVFIYNGFQQAGEEAKKVSLAKAADGTMAVHYIDVGQGDSEFVELPNGETMLIDAGEKEQGQTVVNYINSLGYEEITYLIATHPHTDHIGGLAAVLREFDVKNVYMPNAVTTSSTYDKFLTAVEKENCSVIEAKAGVSVVKDESKGLAAYMLAPAGSGYESLNNYSAVLKIEFFNTSFLFMGDAETVSENEINADVSADVVKVGHHGSNSSSSAAFVKRVSPQYAVIECGVDNSYGHPHKEPLARWQSVGAEILRTDTMGTIVITSDGVNLTVSYDSASKGAQATAPAADYKWALNTNTKKIHYPSCTSVTEGNGKNIEYSNKSLEELQSAGYTPCGRCNPHE